MTLSKFAVPITAVGSTAILAFLLYKKKNVPSTPSGAVTTSAPIAALHPAAQVVLATAQHVTNQIALKQIASAPVLTPIPTTSGQSAAIEIDQKVKALDSGADDYLIKPFNFLELKARVRALLRRQSQTARSSVLKVGDLTLDLTKRTVQRGNQDIALHRKEFKILEYFMHNAGKIITRNMILEHVWDSEFESLTNVVDVHIKYLRDQVDKNFNKKLIKTIYGMGYKLEA